MYYRSCNCFVQLYLCNGLNVLLGRTTSMPKAALLYELDKARSPIWKLALSHYMPIIQSTVFVWWMSVNCKI